MYLINNVHTILYSFVFIFWTTNVIPPGNIFRILVLVCQKFYFFRCIVIISLTIYFCFFIRDFTLIVFLGWKTFGWLKGPNKTDFVMLLTRTNIVIWYSVISFGMRERVNKKMWVWFSREENRVVVILLL